MKNDEPPLSKPVPLEKTHDLSEFDCGVASDLVGIRAVLTHAKEHEAKAFSERFGFEPSPVDELHLYLLMKDIKNILAGQA